MGLRFKIEIDDIEQASDYDEAKAREIVVDVLLDAIVALRTGQHDVTSKNLWVWCKGKHEELSALMHTEYA